MMNEHIWYVYWTLSWGSVEQNKKQILYAY